MSEAFDTITVTISITRGELLALKALASISGALADKCSDRDDQQAQQRRTRVLLDHINQIERKVSHG